MEWSKFESDGSSKPFAEVLRSCVKLLPSSVHTQITDVTEDLLFIDSFKCDSSL